jgi:primosomal protein N' (replication factor Y) (superfamily II helicase)
MNADVTSSSSEKTQYIGGERVAVLLPLPLGMAYDYLVPDGVILNKGDFVDVPLGHSGARGVVWGPGTGDVDAKKLKEIKAPLDAAPLPPESAAFVDWVSKYTLAMPGAVLRMCMSVPEALDPAKLITAYVARSSPEPFKSTPARERVLNVLKGGPPRILSDLALEAGTGTGVVKGLLNAGVIETVSLAPPPPPEPDYAQAGHTLSPAQSDAAGQLCDAVTHGFSVHVLDGVPGSGKTEVYFEAVARALAAGKQALVMLPEIALGAQWRKRFNDRFGCAPLEWHSDLTRAQKREIWRTISKGGARVVVGARSSLFLPYPDLGLIVADEEHDAAYKQEDGVIYNARDMAVVRARIGELPIVLASATPSLETAVNVAAGRYDTQHLPERHAGAALPQVDLIDMRAEKLPATRWISGTLRDALTDVFDQGEQAMLFLNRRGYAPLTLCRACGFRMHCPQCSAWLVEHRLLGRLQCHHCGHNVKLPEICPNEECGAEGKFAACGPGVERLAEELEGLFPDVRYTLAASDTIHSPRAAEELIRTIENHEVDVIIGTQIVAKGYHFPMLTLVGVVDADLGLSGGDLRAAERTYQLLYQVAGRAGREQRQNQNRGRVMMQTYLPDHPVMKSLAAGDREGFIKTETHARETTGMPPFGRLAALIVSGKDETSVERAATALGRAAPHGNGIQVFGPAPAPISMLRGRHRRRLLLKTAKDVAVQPLLKRWISIANIPRKVRVQIDIDPYSFM